MQITLHRRMRRDVLSVLLIVLGGCSAELGQDSELDTTEPLDSRVTLTSTCDAPPDAGPPRSDAGPPDERPKTLPFSIEVAGTTQPVNATVTLQSFGHIVVTSYPTSATVSATYGMLPVGFDGAFSSAFCADIRAKSKVALGTNASARFARQQVRAGGGVTVNIPVSPFIGPAFESALREAAIAAGAPGTGFVLDNPLAPDEVRVRFTFADDAITPILGGIDELTRQQNGFAANQLDAIQISGMFNTATAAKDLLCDLALGKATLNLDLSASGPAGGYLGHTTVGSLLPD